MFWANVLSNNEMTMSDTVRTMIRSALAIPAGSAAAERSFGMMNYINDSYRATLSQENTNHLIRIRHNGPTAGGIRMKAYVEKYLETHERCDPLHQTGKSRPKEAKEAIENENIYSTIFSI